MNVNLGLVSVSYRKLTTEAIIEACKAAGLSCIEWGSDVHVPQTDVENARRVGEATRAAGLKVSSYGTYYRLGQGQDFTAYLDAAEALGAPVLRLWAGVRGSADVDPETRAAWVADAKRCARMAAARGLQIHFEYHPVTLTDERHSAVRLMEEIGDPHVRLYWQPDFTRSMEEIVAGLEQALPYVDILHVFTWKPNHVRLSMEEGRAFWVDILSRIPDLHEKKLLLEFVPGDDPALLSREAGILDSIENEVLENE